MLEAEANAATALASLVTPVVSPVSSRQATPAFPTLAVSPVGTPTLPISAKPAVKSTPIFRRNTTRISPEMEKILNSRVPALAPKRKRKAEIPKAMTGAAATAFFQQREAEKEMAKQLKLQRQLEREEKRRKKEEEAKEKASRREELKKERERKKREMEIEKERKKNEKAQRKMWRKGKSSVAFQIKQEKKEEAEEAEKEAADQAIFSNICPKCKSCKDEEAMVGCDICEQWWHRYCVDKLKDLDDDELDDTEFYCALCTGGPY